MDVGVSGVTGPGVQGWIGPRVSIRMDSMPSGCTVFWFLGVNFLPQLLHRRILRIPIALVFLEPLLTVFVEPQPS